MPIPHFHSHASEIEAAIDELCSDKYAETSYDGMGELSDLIASKQHPESDVTRAISHHLLGDSVQAQKRALTVLEGLVEMGQPAFQRSFATPDLVRALRSISSSYGTDNGVRRKLMLILLSWHKHFMRDPEMAHVSSLYGLCGGVEREHLLPPKVEEPQRPRHQAVDLLHSSGSSVEGTLEASTRETEALWQAVMAASESHVPIMESEDVKTHAMLVLELQKEVVQYIHTVGDADYIGTLIDANDKIVDVLQRLQDAAAGIPVQTHAPGTLPSSKEELILNASRRLSLPDAVHTPANELLRDIDHSLMVHSGFTTAAPSRSAMEPPEHADPNEIDMSVVERNTQQVQGSVSGRPTAPPA